MPVLPSTAVGSFVTMTSRQNRGQLGQREGSRDAGVVSEGGRDYVVVDTVHDPLRYAVALQDVDHAPPDVGEEVALLHDSAAHHYALGRQGHGDIGDSVSQVLCLQVPGRVALGQGAGGGAPPGLHRGAGGQPFEAVAVVRARPVEGVGGAVVGDADVSHLRVARAVERAAFYDRAASDAGAYGDVDQAADCAAIPPAVFSQGGGVYVGVERDREPELLNDGAYEIDVPPAGLGCRRDVAVRG